MSRLLARRPELRLLSRRRRFSLVALYTLSVAGSTALNLFLLATIVDERLLRIGTGLVLAAVTVISSLRLEDLLGAGPSRGSCAKEARKA